MTKSSARFSLALLVLLLGWPAAMGQTYLPGPAPIVGDIMTMCVEEYPTPRDRTTIGVGEKVTCSIGGFQDTDYMVDPYGKQWPVSDTMGDVIWSVTGPGSVFPTIGMTTTLTAADDITVDTSLTLNAEVHDSGKLGKDAPVKKQKGMVNTTPKDVNVLTATDVPDPAWKSGDKNLGARADFLVQVIPTNVNFKGQWFYNTKPAFTINWPDGKTNQSYNSSQSNWGVLANFGATPNLIHVVESTELRPVSQIAEQDFAVSLFPVTWTWVIGGKYPQNFGSPVPLYWSFKGLDKSNKTSISLGGKTSGLMGPWQ